MWAPKIFYYDDLYYIIWSSTINSKYAPPEEVEPWWKATYNHSAYYFITKDFRNFSEVRKFWDPGYSMIDATIISNTDKFYIFYKDERAEAKNVIMGKSSEVAAPYMNLRIVTNTGVKGPIVIKKDNSLNLYYDRFWGNKGYAFRTDSIQKFNEEKEIIKVDFDKTIRHGSIVKITRDELQDLLLKTEKRLIIREHR